MNVSSNLAMKGALVAIAAAGVFAMSSATASARVVCNRWHECWRTNGNYRYPARFGIVIRTDNWAARHAHDRAWRWRAERHDRGYWRNGTWHRW